MLVYELLMISSVVSSSYDILCILSLSSPFISSLSSSVLLSIKELDINAKDDDGWTPLHAAVHWESMEAAELLIFNGANVYAKTDAVSLTSSVPILTIH